MPRPYPSEFRERAMELIRSGPTVVEIAGLLGIAPSCLYRWKQQDLVDRGLKPDTARVESKALAAARARIRDLKEAVKILRKAAAAVEQVVPPKEGFRLVDELHADGVRIRRACHAVGVSTSGYYEWRNRAPSARAIRHAFLTDLIGQIHDASYGTYGRLPVRAELHREHGITVGHNTVALLMHRSSLAGLPLRRRSKQIPHRVTVTDRVKRQFTASGPNRLWVTDITEQPTRKGKHYCCVVIDVFSRRVVGWAIDSTQRAELATNALGMAIDFRRPFPETVIHGDHGSQFTSWAFTARARNAGPLPSLGTVGDPYDNAVAGSFWARMQVELLNRRRWTTRIELANAIFEYIEGFHNRRRRHGTLAWAAPLEFENQHLTTAATL
ncbi:MAG: IS3 family transposase [Micrococcales bacterium]|nr:IS3 family transposase [Micrococcales bacterium]